MAIDDSILIQQCYKPINEALSKNSTRQKYLRFMTKYIDANSQVYANNIPSKRPNFPMAELEKVIGVKSNDFVQPLKNAKLNPALGKVAHNASYLYATLVLRYFILHRDKRGMNAARDMVSTIIYSLGIYNKYFPKFDPDETIMTYTFNRMNNRVTLKREGTVLKWLNVTLDFWIKNPNGRKAILSNDDEELVSFQVNAYSRINRVVKQFANEYNIDREAGNRQSTAKEMMTDLNGDQAKKDIQNTSTDLYRVSNNAISRFASQSLDSKGISFASKTSDKNNKIRPDILKGSLTEIKGNEIDKMGELISLALIVYTELGGEPDRVKSSKFIKFMMESYSKSNIRNDNMRKIKEITDYFLINYGQKYSMSSRPQTQMIFKKAVFNYALFIIVASA